MQPSALATQNDPTSFVPEKDLRSALAAAQSAARQRDELVSENARLRREVESSARARRELEEATAGGGDNVSKRLRLLREALVRKDQEILNLKTFQQGHARQLQQAKETADRLRRERADLEERLRSHEGAFHAIEAERQNLTRALDGVRRGEDEAARVMQQADSVVGEWRVAWEQSQRELADARQSYELLRQSWEALHVERDRFAVERVQALELLANERAAAQKFQAVLDDAMTDAQARYDAAREAHAIALRAAEDDHAATVAELREAHAAQLAEVRAAHDAEVARLGEAHAVAIAALHESHAQEIDARRAAHAHELDALREDHAAALDDEREKIALVVREACAPIESEREGLKIRLREVEGVRDWADAEAAAMRARAEAAEATLREVESSHAREVESLSAELDALQKRHDDETARLVKDFEAEIESLRTAQSVDAARELRSLGDKFAEAEGRARTLAAECEAHRGRVAKLEAELAEVRAALDEARADVVEGMADRDARTAATVRDLKELHGEELRDAEARYARALDEAREYFTAALDAQRESHEAEMGLLRDSLTDDEARHLDLERELESAREALGNYAAESAERILAAERAADEAAAARDRYAQRAATLHRRVQELESAPTSATQLQLLSRMMGEVMSASVIELSKVAAWRAGRRGPEVTDVEEAISILCDVLPDDVSDLLWAQRDAFAHRARA